MDHVMDSPRLGQKEPPDADTRRSVFRNVSGFFLTSEFFERMAFYGFAGSLVLYFQRKLNMPNDAADIS
jgi:dipeptide/tripeptide permease